LTYLREELRMSSDFIALLGVKVLTSSWGMWYYTYKRRTR